MIPGCTKIKFFTFLTNISGPINELELKNGFAIKSVSRDDFLAFMKEQEPSIFTGWTISQMEFRLYKDNESKIFVIEKEFIADEEKEERRLCLREGANIFYEKYEKYLDDVIGLLNLFSEGSIFAPERCYQYYEGEKKSCFYHEQRYMPPLPTPNKFTIDNTILERIQTFIDSIAYPFENKYIQLAFDNFLESYHTRNLNLSYLSLMMALEALLSRGNQELVYSIRRNMAVLIGKTAIEADTIYRNINKHYQKRSKVVHGDESQTIGRPIVMVEDIIDLRQYVRRAIKEAIELNLNKENLLDLLNKRGFPL